MLLDVSNVNPYIVLGVIGVIMLLAIIKGIRYGIIQCLVNLVIFGGLCYAIVLFTPTVAGMVAGYGFLEQLIGLVGGGGFFGTFLLSIVGPAYTIVTGLLLFIVGFIIFRIFTYLTRVIFRKKNFVIRFLGMIYNIVFNASMVGVLLIVLSSPLLFSGGQTLINNTMGVSQFYQLGVVQAQNMLRANNLPATVEDVLFRLLGAEVTTDEVEQILSTLERMNEIMADPETYFGELFDESDQLNEAMIDDIIGDMEAFSVLFEALPSETQDTLIDSIAEILDGYLESLVDPDKGDPITYTATPEQQTSLEAILANMPGLPTTTTDLIYDIFGVGTHS